MRLNWNPTCSGTTLVARSGKRTYLTVLERARDWYWCITCYATSGQPERFADGSALTCVGAQEAAEAECQ